MKIVNKFLVALVCLSTVGSCNFLDKEPDTEQTLDLVFNSDNTVRDWLAGVYNGIACPVWEWTRNHGIEQYADDVYASYGWRQYWGSILDPLYGGWSTTSSFAEANYWSRMPQYIRQAYIFRQRAHALSNLPQSEIDLMKAESRFLAAYYYYILLVNYGSIPVRPLDDIASTEATIEDLQGKQWPFDDVVDYLDTEFLETAELLPAIYGDASKYGRVTSIMCHTMRSKLLLFAASPLVNGNKRFAGHMNKDGVEVFNSTYDAGKWTRAKEATKLLIDEAHAAGHKLYVEYNPDGSIDPFMSLQELWFVSNRAGNTEVLFPYTKDDDGINFTEYTKHGMTHADDMGGNGGLGVYQGLVDAFFMENGLPIDHPDGGYSEVGFTSGVETRNTQWYGGGPNVGDITLDHTFNMWANREPRFYLTVTYHGSWLAPVKRRLDLTNGSVLDWSTQVDNNHTHDAPNNGYLIKKKTDPLDRQSTPQQYRGRDGFNSALYRLAATYLDYAEIANEADDTAAARAEAIEYVNMIRERAGVRKYSLTPVAASDPDFITCDNTQDAVRRAVRMERRVELCTEGSRWYDIRRWMIAESIPEITGWVQGMNYNATSEEEFLVRTNAGASPRVWQEQYYWQPIHIGDIEDNPNLVQNPKW